MGIFHGIFGDTFYDRTAEIVRLHELQMQSIAGMYRLWSGDGRKKSTRALVDLFFGIVRITKPAVFIEAGAKEATASKRVRGILENVEIHAFEANPYNVKYFSGDPEFQAKGVNYRHLALTDKDGSVTFNIRKTVDGKDVDPVSGENSLLLQKRPDIAYEEVSVPAKRLDSVFPSPRPNAIWMDVEGATGKVVQGARNVLAETLVTIVEMSDHGKWKEEWLSHQVIRFFYEQGLIPVARDFEYASQYNVVFIKDNILQYNFEVKRNIEYFYSELARK